ncbi:AraC family transcriptional regulator [Alkalimonas collagenimarina]|uniref:AraC family transcriptional regulator n=1 Tax=Alkalimonas collagenimarina TaxID=400390 RepID=A0ABT9GVU0_9GAMM|nr:AraC family transcriptional regulator [Alkalimonas collagenimarina]MDP4535138.1 AraC family transcriptional regulator [Alkalimonas collagenimarina]
MRNLEYAVQKTLSFTRKEGLHTTALPWLSIVRSNKPTTFEMVLYEPSVCIVLQGKKETRLEQVTYQTDTANYVVGALSLPVLGAVMEASDTSPYLCLRIDIDSKVIAELVDSQALAQQPCQPVSGMAVAKMDEYMMDTVGRLLDSLHSPATSQALAPLIQKEIYWRLLQQVPLETLLLQLVKDSKQYALYKTIKWLEENFAQSDNVEHLAQLAGMSLSSFYTHFKAVTGISPLQYRNRLRLVKARKLMIAKGYHAAQAGFEVGYQEPAQFSREYSRLFGMPPKKDIARIKASALGDFV